MVEREKWVDSAKAIAIILVMLGHVSGDLTGWFNFKFVYGFHLVIFYIISGYFTKQRPLSLDFVNKKFHRLMVPYFLTCGVILFMDAFNLFFIYKERSITSITGVIAKDLTRSFYASGDYAHFGEMEMGGRIGAIWFLPALFFSAVAVFLLVRWMYRRLGSGQLHPLFFHPSDCFHLSPKNIVPFYGKICCGKGQLVIAG